MPNLKKAASQVIMSICIVIVVVVMALLATHPLRRLRVRIPAECCINLPIPIDFYRATARGLR